MEKNRCSLNDLGKKIKQLRSVLGLSQKEFAQALDVSNSYLSGIEHGNKSPKFEFLFKIAVQYNVSPDYLFFGTEPMIINHKRKSTAGKKEKQSITAIDTTEDLLWLIDNSTLFRDTIMGYSAKFHLENEDIIKKNIENTRKKSNAVKIDTNDNKGG